jgi:general nucleoside transport system permease protein
MSTPYAELPRWVDVGLLPVVNVAAAFFVSGLVVLLIGENPIEALQIIFRGAFGYGEGIGFTLYYATNFIFAGLAVAVAFHAGLFNIGGEGQAAIGGLGVALICLGLGSLPFLLILPIAILGSALFGAAWAFVPAYLQAKRGSHIVITTIMFNFIASALMVYLLVNVIKAPATMSPETSSFSQSARLPSLHEMGLWLGLALPKSPMNMAFFLSLIAAVGVWVLIWKSRLGYELRTVGHNPVAAVYGGIKPDRITIVAMLISGGLAGMMALNTVMGEQYRLVLDFTAGAGFVGIAVALMGRSHPFGIVLASILFGMLYQGGAELAFEKPTINRDMIVVIQGLVILFAGALENMFRPGLAALFAGRPKTAGA